MWVSRIGVVCWATFMGVIMCIAQVAQINVNWLINIIGEQGTELLDVQNWKASVHYQQISMCARRMQASSAVALCGR